MKGNQDQSIIVEARFKTSSEKLWQAITDEDQMRQWFFENIPAFNPEEGFETQFNVKSNGRNFLHQWKIMRVIPKQELIVNWKYGGYPGESFVTFKLKEDNGSTYLQLMHEGIETFPDSIPEFKRESCEEGWNFFVNQLKDFLK